MVPPRIGAACSFTGLPRTYFTQKVLGVFGEAIVQVSFRQKGETKGTRLAFVPSIHDLLLSFAKNRGNASYGSLVRNRFESAKSVQVPQHWLRAPQNGRCCDFTGLGHWAFYELLERAGDKIFVAQLKLPTESRSSRLVWLPSLHSYLLRLAQEQAATL
jgi:hypothetical protein